MLQRVVRVLMGVVDPVVVVAAPGQETPELPPAVRLVRDPIVGRGPLQGLATGLAALRDQVEAAYVSSCDVPLLQPAFVRYLIDLLQDEEIVAAREDAIFHPLAAVYRTSVLSEVDTRLKEGRLRLTLLLEERRVRAVPVEDLREVDPDLRSLRNVNSPEDYREALKIAGLRPETWGLDKYTRPE